METHFFKRSSLAGIEYLLELRDEYLPEESADLFLEKQKIRLIHRTIKRVVTILKILYRAKKWE